MLSETIQECRMTALLDISYRLEFYPIEIQKLYTFARTAVRKENFGLLVQDSFQHETGDTTSGHTYLKHKNVFTSCSITCQEPHTDRTVQHNSHATSRV